MSKKIYTLILAFSLIASVASAQWFHDDMNGPTSGTAPSPYVNTSAACNPPGITNQGVTIVGQVGAPTWFGGWDGSGSGTGASAGSCITWTNFATGNTSVVYTYTLAVTGNATISSMTFGARRNSNGHQNISVSINGTSYTPSPATLTTTGWTPVSVSVSPVRNFTAGNTITIVVTYDGTAGSSIVQRLDELKIFGSSSAPVEMTEFTVKPAPLGFDLQWRTAIEKDNDYFAVERSHDGRSYAEIARVDGSGNSIVTQSYQYNDRTPLDGDNYYRLKQVDFDGQFEYSKSIVIRQNSKDKVSVFPNPSNGIFTISGLSDEEEEPITLMNSVGQIIAVAVQPNGQLDLSAYPSGIYYIDILYLVIILVDIIKV